MEKLFKTLNSVTIFNICLMPNVHFYDFACHIAIMTTLFGIKLNIYIKKVLGEVLNGIFIHQDLNLNEIVFKILANPLKPGQTLFFTL